MADCGSIRGKGRQHRSDDRNPEVEKIAARYRHAAGLQWLATLTEIERVGVLRRNRRNFRQIAGGHCWAACRIRKTVRTLFSV